LVRTPRPYGGDAAVFTSLYAEYRPRLAAYLTNLLHDASDVDDVVQEVFVQAIEALPEGRLDARAVEAWLFTTAKHRALDRLRSRRRVMPRAPEEIWRERDEAGARATFGALAWGSTASVHAQLSALPSRQREALVLRHFAGLSTEEIARATGRRPSAVRKLEQRALRQLQARLKPGRRAGAQGEHGTRALVS
jgi:RNA polymerase sigma-70 factor (ECF subfamily)